MHPGVAGELGMEGRGHDSSLADDDRIAALGRNHFDARPDTLNFRSTDEDHLDRGTFELALANRTVDLAAVSIAANADVENAETLLFGVFDLVCKQDGAGTGTE